MRVQVSQIRLESIVEVLSRLHRHRTLQLFLSQTSQALTGGPLVRLAVISVEATTLFLISFPFESLEHEYRFNNKATANMAVTI